MPHTPSDLPLESTPQTHDALPKEFQVPDILQLVRAGTHYTALREGVLHVVDASTGHSLAITKTNPGANSRYIRRTNPDGTYTWCLEELRDHESCLSYAQYSPLVVDEICRRIVEGEALTRICNGAEGMPTYNDFCRWRRAHPWIIEALDRAREDRAEKLRDEAIALADDAVSVKDAAAQALKVEVRKWAAAVDSARYNPKTKVEATLNVPTQIIVQTGIEREPIKDVTPMPSLPHPTSRGDGG